MKRNNRLTLLKATGILFVAIALSLLIAAMCFSASVNDSYWKNLSVESLEQVQDDKSRGEPYFFLGVAYAYMGELELAIDAFTDFEAIDLNRQLRRQIIEDYKHAEQYTSGHSEETLRDWSILAFAYYSDYRYPESIAMFNRLIEAEPSNVWHYMYLGYVYGLNGQLDEAISTIQSGLAREPKNEYLRALLAAAYFEKGMTAKAALELLKAPGIVKRLIELNRL